MKRLGGQLVSATSRLPVPLAPGLFPPVVAGQEPARVRAHPGHAIAQQCLRSYLCCWHKAKPPGTARSLKSRPHSRGWDPGDASQGPPLARIPSHGGSTRATASCWSLPATDWACAKTHVCTHSHTTSSLPHSHTQTYSHARTLTHSYTYTLHSMTHSHTCTLSHAAPHTWTHAHSHTTPHTQTHLHTLPHYTTLPH